MFEGLLALACNNRNVHYMSSHTSVSRRECLVSFPEYVVHASTFLSLSVYHFQPDSKLIQSYIIPSAEKVLCSNVSPIPVAARSKAWVWVRIPLVAWLSVSCECCVLSGRGLCDRPILRPEIFCRLCVCVCVCVCVCQYDHVQQ